MIRIIWDDRISWKNLGTKWQLVTFLLLAMALAYIEAWLIGGLVAGVSSDLITLYIMYSIWVLATVLLLVVMASKKAIKAKRLFVDPPLAFRKLWCERPPRDKVERRLMQDSITTELRVQAQHLIRLFDKLLNLSDPRLMKYPWMEANGKVTQLREVRKEIARCKRYYWKKSNAAKPYFNVERTIEEQAKAKLMIEVQAEKEEQAKKRAEIMEEAHQA